MKKKTIGTHNGNFHCDESLACFMLLQTKEFKNAEIIRTREPSILSKLDILVDVGGIYNPKEYKFDHHQIGFNETLDKGHTIKLSSAGLIYKHFGKEIIKNSQNIIEEDIVEIIFQKIYTNFIEEIDAIDNGISMYSSDIIPKYIISTNISSRVSALNPSWNEKFINVDEQFKKAIELTGKEFMDKINFYYKVWLPARKIVENAIYSRFSIDSSGKIICLEQFCPWKEHFFDLEKELNLNTTILYCIFSDNNNLWRVQCIPKRLDSFENRLSLCWKGYRDEELSEKSGIDGCIFVHISGFIGGNKTKEGAILMAKKSIQILQND